MANIVNYGIVMSMASALMTKEQIKLRLDLDEKDYREMIARFPELDRRRLGSVLAGNARRKNPKLIYLDVSYLNVWGNKEGVRKLSGKGLLYATHCPDYRTQNISLSELSRRKDEFLVICGTTEKADMMRRNGYTVSTYLLSKTMERQRKGVYKKPYYQKREKLVVKVGDNKKE